MAPELGSRENSIREFAHLDLRPDRVSFPSYPVLCVPDHLALVVNVLHNQKMLVMLGLERSGPETIYCWLSFWCDHVLEFCVLYMFHTFLNEIMAEATRLTLRSNKSALTNANINNVFFINNEKSEIISILDKMPRNRICILLCGMLL